MNCLPEDLPDPARPNFDTADRVDQIIDEQADLVTQIARLKDKYAALRAELLDIVFCRRPK